MGVIAEQLQRDIFCRFVRDCPEAFKDPIDEFFKANPNSLNGGSERFEELINSVGVILARALPQDDLEKQAEVMVCVAYVYQRCMQKANKSASDSLVNFLKRIQSGKVLSFQEKENKRAAKGRQLIQPPPQELASLSDEEVLKILAHDQDPLVPFKNVLRDHSVSSIQKFQLIGDGFDVASRVMKMLFKNLQRLNEKEVKLEEAIEEEKGKREALEDRLVETKKTLGKTQEDNFAFCGKLDDGKAKREGQDDKIKELERKNQEFSKKLEAQDKTIKVQSGVIDNQKEEQRKGFKEAADEAWSNQIKWTVFTILTFGILSPLMEARRRKWAMLKAQDEIFDRLSQIADPAEKIQQINIYANKLLSQKGFWARITGTQKFSNGRLYTGEYIESSTLIDGILTGPDDYWYSGRFYDGKPHGQQGVEKSPNGTYYGEFSHGKYHGFGIMEMANGDYFAGRFIDGQKEELGILKLDNGDEYRGPFKKGEFDGIGRYEYGSGDFLEGIFQEGYFLHGKGRLKYANGNSYRGEYIDGKYHGNGCLDFADGDSYNGEFIEGKIHGEGCIRYASGDSYLGKFKEERFHGFGRLSFASGGYYMGLFLNGNYNGKGYRSFSPDSDYISYDGEFKDDQFHGTGVLVYADGRIEKGRFENGLFQG